MGGGKKPKHTCQTCWVSIKLTLLYKRVRFRIIWLKQEMLFSPLDTETFCFPQPNSNHWRGNLSVSYKYCQWKISLEGKSYCFLKEREYIYNFCTLWIFKDILKESSFYTPPHLVTVQQSLWNLIMQLLCSRQLVVVDCFFCCTKHPRLFQLVWLWG